jgi:hypothetical protein
LSITTLPDADVTTLTSQSLARLYEAPITPSLSENVNAIFAIGQTLGRDASVVTKIGDSLSADENFLEVLGREPMALGAYGYLTNTVDYYGASTVGGSVAARVGLSSLVINDSFWADKSICEPNETPLDCEIRVKNPSVAVILFGPNDILSMTYEEYGENMRRLTESVMEAGVIPVLSTFSYHPDEPYWLQSVEFNLQLVDIAEEYDVPLINLWSATRILPEYGLDIDRTHLLQSGFNTLKYDTGHEAFYGTSLRNLLVLRTLHDIRLQLELGES